MKPRLTLLYALVVLLVNSINTYSQSIYDTTYLTSEQSYFRTKLIISGLQSRLINELNNLPENNHLLKREFVNNSSKIIKLAEDDFFLNDWTIDSIVTRTFKRILKANSIDSLHKSVLIMREAEANAACVGEGTFFITLGLLAELQSESQLAFILAHELAHYQLQDILSTYSNNYRTRKLARRESAKIIAGRASVNGILELRQEIYKTSKFSREKELVADSVGLTYFAKADYDQMQAPAALSKFLIRDSISSEEIKKLFAPLHSDRYHFKTSWLSENWKIYSRNRIEFFVPIDSIKSHPDTEERINRLQKLTLNARNLPSEANYSFLKISEKSKFEVIAASLEKGEIDYCLLEALKLLQRYPKNSFLINSICKVFIQLHEIIAQNSLNQRLPPKSYEYGAEIREVNSFLRALSKSEVGDLCYYFLSRDENFNENNEEQYYLLWKISDLTNRKETSEYAFSTYKRKFPRGEYSKKMK